MPRFLAAVVIGLAVLVAAAPADAAHHVHARTVKLEVDSSVSGNYTDSIAYGADSCGSQFHEDATFDFLNHYKTLSLKLQSHAHAVAQAKRIVANGEWHQTGTWWSENDCSSAPHSDDCTGAMGFNRPHGGAVAAFVSGGKVLFSPASGAESIGELATTFTNCPSVSGDGGQPVFGALSALEPWDPALASISLAKLAAVKKGKQITIKMKPGPSDSDFDGSGCNHAPACSGALDASGHLFVKVLK